MICLWDRKKPDSRPSPPPPGIAAIKPFQTEPKVTSWFYLWSTVCHFLRYIEGYLLCFLLFLAGEKGYGKGYKRDNRDQLCSGRGHISHHSEGSQWNLILSSGGRSWSVTLKRAKNSFQPGSLFPYF